MSTDTSYHLHLPRCHLCLPKPAPTHPTSNCLQARLRHRLQPCTSTIALVPHASLLVTSLSAAPYAHLRTPGLQQARQFKDQQHVLLLQPGRPSPSQASCPVASNTASPAAIAFCSFLALASSSRTLRKLKFPLTDLHVQAIISYTTRLSHFSRQLRTAVAS